MGRRIAKEIFMNKNFIAVIDLGTNTFHLLIVQVLEDGSFKEVYRERKFVKLGEKGIETIGNAAYHRGLDTLKGFYKKIIELNVPIYRAFGTAALRTASNGATFREEVLKDTGIRIDLIDGDREATLIHKGVKLVVPFDDQKKLVMDIGGGSVEFIIANNVQVFWARSFPVGVSVLFNAFHHSDPISTNEQQQLIDHLVQVLKPLQLALLNHPLSQLVGASGTFDVIEDILVQKKEAPHYSRLETSKLPNLTKVIIESTLDQRLKMKGIPDSRSDMIVVAMLLIDYVIHLAGITEIFISSYAMKEGMLTELIAQENPY